MIFYLQDAADETEEAVEQELKPRLEDAIQATDDLADLNERIRIELDKLNGGLDQLPEGNVREKKKKYMKITYIMLITILTPTIDWYHSGSRITCSSSITHLSSFSFY